MPTSLFSETSRLNGLCYRGKFTVHKARLISTEWAHCLVFLYTWGESFASQWWDWILAVLLFRHSAQIGPRVRSWLASSQNQRLFYGRKYDWSFKLAIQTLPHLRNSNVPEGLAKVGNGCTDGQLYTYRENLSSCNQNSNTMEPDRPQHERPAACYRPAVFFCHLHLTALSFPLGKIRRAFQTLFYFWFFKKFVPEIA